MYMRHSLTITKRIATTTPRFLYPWRQMDINDEFLIPSEYFEGRHIDKIQSFAITEAKKIGDKYNMKFSTRRINQGVLVRRIK